MTQKIPFLNIEINSFGIMLLNLKQDTKTGLSDHVHHPEISNLNSCVESQLAVSATYDTSYGIVHVVLVAFANTTTHF